MTPDQLSLYADCASCVGLCCRALYFSRLDGFPQDKPAGVACRNLCEDYRCRIHATLKQKGMKGCLGYDCIGAGQAAVKKGVTHDADLFAVYLKLFPLHQMLWYLCEAVQMEETISFHKQLHEHLQTIQAVCAQPWQELLTCDSEELHKQTSELLKQTIAQKKLRQYFHSDHLIGKRLSKRKLRNADFTMKALIAADLSCCDLQGTCFLGSDLRDCNLSASDLRGCFFLTQMQINSAIGNAQTRLPKHLLHPTHWL